MKKKQILIVANERLIAEDIKMTLQRLGYSACGIAISTKEAVKKAEEMQPDLVLMDIVLKGEMDGIESSALIRSRFDIPVVYLTAYSDDKTLERAKITEPFAYILKPFEDKYLHTTIEMALYKRKMENMVQEREKRSRKNLEETVNALALAVETRDPYAVGHQRKVTNLAFDIAKEMGLPKAQIDGLCLAGHLHDIGKIHIPAEILIKPCHLSETEFLMIKIHPQIGYDILKPIEFSSPIAQVILQHHERMDGSGYPASLSGEEILLEARILAVADVVEAMSSPRPYRATFGTDMALKEITKCKGALYDPKVVDACLKLFHETKLEL